MRQDTRFVKSHSYAVILVLSDIQVDKPLPVQAVSDGNMKSLPM